MLLMAQDFEGDGSRMTDRQVRDEAMTIFLAGHETTANALSWTWYLLGGHPAVEARMHDEIDRVLGGRLPTMDDVPSCRSWNRW
jgi:cytochrome P450